MFPFRYGRRNSGGNTRSPVLVHHGGGGVGGVSKLVVFSSWVKQRLFVVWELRSGRGHHHLGGVLW